jgi:uncharacterized protein (TIGR02231 family)
MRSLLAFLLVGPVLAAAADLQAPSRVDAVTVYASAARVTRVAKVTLPSGDVRLLLEGVSDRLADDSVRVRGRGSADAKVFGVSVERVVGAEAAAEEARAAQDRLDRLLDQDRALRDDLEAAKARREFVDSLRSTYSEERAKNLAVRGVSSREWADLAGFTGREQAAAAAAARQAEVARRELGRRIEAARAELQKLQAKRGTARKTIAVELRAEKGGSFEVEVSYLVPAAGWRPIWDARLLPEKNLVELALHASVTQSSGEDWSGVRLAVSTAEPGRGLRVPELEPHWIDKVRPPAPRPAAAQAPRRGMAMKAAPAAAAPQKEEAEAPMEMAMEEPAAEMAQGLLSATFTAPRRESVDGAGRARKVFLARFPLPAEVSRTAAPRLDPVAYLTAKAVNEAGAPLLPGDASVFLGDEFVGRAALPATPPGGELRLAFGADERIKVERRVVERRHETSGLLSKDDVYRYRVRVSVKNLTSAPAPVRLLDLVPVSRDEEIRVKVLDGSTPPTEPEDPMKPGVRTWVLPLQPKEEKVVELRYEVRFPRGTAVSGLE